MAQTQGTEFPITIGDYELLLARDKSGALQWQATHGVVPVNGAGGATGDRFKEVVPFGNGGIGGSIASQYDLHHYSQDVQTYKAGWLGPGPLQRTMGLALTSPITKIRSTHDADPVIATAIVATGSDGGTGGGAVWTNPTNITATGGGNASTTTYLAVSPSSILIGRNISASYGSIPTEATIVGIMVEPRVITSAATRLAAQWPTMTVQLRKAGVAVGNAQTISAATLNAASALTYIPVGDSGSLWGTTWAPADFASTTFGVQLTVVDANGNAGNTVVTQVDVVRFTVWYTLAGRMLYASSGNVIKAITLTTHNGVTAPTVTATNTLTTGNAKVPTVSDFIFIKEQRGVATPTQDVNFLLVGFGDDNPIITVDAIDYTGAFTLRSSPDNTAYAKLFTFAPTKTNTSIAVWRALNWNGTTEGGVGPFQFVNNAVIGTTSTDYSKHVATWTPVTPYVAGPYGHDINSLVSWAGGVGVGKNDAVYSVTEDGTAVPLFQMGGFTSTLNAVNMTAWGTELIIPTIKGLARIPTRGGDAFIGPEALIYNDSAVQGYVSATTRYGDTLYISVYDGTDSYLCIVKHRKWERTPHDYVIHVLAVVSGFKVTAMHAAGDEAVGGYTWLWYGTYAGGTYDLGYCNIEPTPDAHVSWNTGFCYWYSPAMSDNNSLTTIEKLYFYVEGGGPGLSIDVYLAWDGAAAQHIGAIGSGTTVDTITLTPGTNDSGYSYRVSFRWNTNGTRVRLRGGSLTEGGPVGIITEGTRTTATVDKIVATVKYGQGMSNGRGGLMRTPAPTVFAGLKGYTEPTSAAVSVVAEHYTGSTTAVKMRVTSVSEVQAEQDSPYPTAKTWRIEMHELLGS